MRHHQPRRSRVLWWAAVVVLVLPISVIQAVVFMCSWLLLGVRWSAGMALVTSGCLTGLGVLQWAGRRQRERHYQSLAHIPQQRGEPRAEWDELIRGRQ